MSLNDEDRAEINGMIDAKLVPESVRMFLIDGTTRRRCERIETDVAELNQNVSNLTNRFERQDIAFGRFAEHVAKNFETVDNRFETVDRRFDDQQTLLEQILARLD